MYLNNDKDSDILSSIQSLYSLMFYSYEDVSIDLEIYDEEIPNIKLYEKITKPVNILNDYRKNVKENWLHNKF